MGLLVQVRVPEGTVRPNKPNVRVWSRERFAAGLFKETHILYPKKPLPTPKVFSRAFLKASWRWRQGEGGSQGLRSPHAVLWLADSEGTGVVLQGLTLSVLSLQEAPGYVLMVIKKLTFCIWWGVFHICKTNVCNSRSVHQILLSKYFQFSSVAQSCPTLCDPMNRSTPGLPVHYQLLEFTQTHVHWVGDAIQSSPPLLSPSPPAFSLSLHQGLFKWVSSSHQVAKILEFQLQHQSFQWTLRTDLLWDELVGSPCCPRDSQESSPTPQFKSINSSALSFLYSPTLTSIHDYWKNHSLD